MIRAILLSLLLAGHVNAQTVLLYAHQDAHQAALLGRLAAIFDPEVIDYTAQRPGTLWRAHLAGHVMRAKTILVIWSAAAAESRELQPELLLSYASAARVVPVLLDATPLPAELAARHAIRLDPLCTASPLLP